MHKIKFIRNAQGQSTVEFALTLILLMSYVLFYFQLTMVFAFGNFVHYATFMSARAYLSAGPDPGDQVQRARDVIVSMLKKSAGQSGTDRFPSIARGTGGNDPPGFEVGPSKEYQPLDFYLNWMQGVRYTFKSKLFMIPLGGTGQAQAPVNSVTLTSESWLGHEPSYLDCQSSMKGWIFDNGC